MSHFDRYQCLYAGPLVGISVTPYLAEFRRMTKFEGKKQHLNCTYADWMTHNGNVMLVFLLITRKFLITILFFEALISSNPLLLFEKLPITYKLTYSESLYFLLIEIPFKSFFYKFPPLKDAFNFFYFILPNNKFDTLTTISRLIMKRKYASFQVGRYLYRNFACPSVR